AGAQITRRVSPELYCLCGGKCPGVPDREELSPSQGGSGSSAEALPPGSCAASARCPALQRGRQHSTSPPRGCRAQELLRQDPGPGAPASATDDTFTKDYTEKLKVAQKKVLRETSFKRKDLQMSLPVRLRQKPSQRPSIEHLRSLSLSSAGEAARPAPCSPPHLESLESSNAEEEMRRPQTGRGGGRQRVTREEKKLCYSEPEKLDQLMDKETWSQGREGITEQDTVGARRRALEDGGRALSSSSISRTELKQIQHTALMEYMERKISQRPGGSQPLPLQKPPLQKRLSHPKGSPGKSSNPNGSRKMQNDEVFCQVFSKEKSPDAPPASAFVPPGSGSSR
ncbi:SHRM1 protein, partial [Serilophus lunatus]|nr:SHRM1 protein [Serilophus lunatus]